MYQIIDLMPKLVQIMLTKALTMEAFIVDKELELKVEQTLLLNFFDQEVLPTFIDKEIYLKLFKIAIHKDINDQKIKVPNGVIITLECDRSKTPIPLPIGPLLHLGLTKITINNNLTKVISSYINSDADIICPRIYRAQVGLPMSELLVLLMIQKIEELKLSSNDFMHTYIKSISVYHYEIAKKLGIKSNLLMKLNRVSVKNEKLRTKQKYNSSQNLKIKMLLNIKNTIKNVTS